MSTMGSFSFVTRVTIPTAFGIRFCRRVCARPEVDSDPVYPGSEHGTAEGEVVLGAPPPARPLAPGRPAHGGRSPPPPASRVWAHAALRVWPIGLSPPATHAQPRARNESM